MDTRKVSAAVGFTLLMGCVVAVVVVIYNGSGVRTSYRSSMEKSWKTRELSMKGKQDVVGSISTTSESPVQEAKKLADELQKLFTSKISHPVVSSTKRVGSGVVTVVDDDDEMGTLEDGKTIHTKNLGTLKEESPSKILPATNPDKQNKISQLDQVEDEVKSHGNPEKDDMDPNQDESPIETDSPDDNDDHYPTFNMPSVNSRPMIPNTQRDPPTMVQQPRSNILLVQSPSSSRHPPQRPTDTVNIRLSPPPRGVNSQLQDRISHGDGVPKYQTRKDHFPLQGDDDTYYQNQGYREPTPLGSREDETADEDYEQDQEEQIVDTRSASARDPLKAMGNMLQLITDVYQRGKDGLDMTGFLRVINETVQRGNNNNLLSQLNQMYSKKPSLLFPPPKSASVGRNALENSLSAFVFMSFGVFLLNQIHNFMGGSGQIGRNGDDKHALRQGRKLDNFDLDHSELNFLFEPPTEADTTTLFNGSEDGKGLLPISDAVKNRPGHQEKNNETRSEVVEKVVTSNRNATNVGVNTLPNRTSNYVNNMFRAAINLVNAYTKDTQALDCIWSKYCQDLDKTSAQHGSLYSIAARINSVGLRLIMGQIQTELTVDAVLHSLLGWDGLPCVKMFSKCNMVHGKLLRQQDDGGINDQRGGERQHNQTGKAE